MQYGIILFFSLFLLFFEIRAYKDIVKKAQDKKIKASAHYQLGLGCYLNKKQYEEALKHFKSCSELDPDNLENLSFLGNFSFFFFY